MKPWLVLDVDGVLHGTAMRYGYERQVVVRERHPREDVHPYLRPRSGRFPKLTVSFATPVRVSPRLFEDLAGLPVDVRMLTTWLELGSVDSFLEQTGCPVLPGRQNLAIPTRDSDGMLPSDWKYVELVALLRADPRPVIWVDDDEVPVWGDQLRAQFPDIPMLLIAPRYEFGLTREHVEQMRAFLSEQPRTS